MSAIIEKDSPGSFVDDQSSPEDLSELKHSASYDDSKCSVDIEAGHNKCEASTPKSNPMAFTIDFGETKQVDQSRLERLAKQSQARHQRVQSMSVSLTRTSPIAQKPPMSAKLPRKTQGYNSEGYFSSDQEDSVLSGSVKLRQSPLTQNADKFHPATTANRPLRSPVYDSFRTRAKMSKSPIVDSIMSRSDILPARQSLNLPLKQSNNSSYVRDVHRTSSYGNISSSYEPHHLMTDIIDQSPEGIMLTDISSPELDILTPDNGLSTPEHKSPSYWKNRRASSETPEMLFKQCVPHPETLFIDDDDVDRQSNNSSTGTYTIEADTYTEEQKARMSIDRTFASEHSNNTLNETITLHDRDPELIFDYPNMSKVITKEPQRDLFLRSPAPIDDTFVVPNKVSKDKNVLEISCCYESPTETDLATQTSKQIKSTRNYLEKIKNRVRTITEKTFPKSPPKLVENPDLGSFTSVTTSGILSSKNPPKMEYARLRRCSLTKSEIDCTDYVHRLSRESSVPVSLPSNKVLPFNETQFESTALRNAHAKTIKDDSGVSSDITPEAVVGKLSYLSLNRCKGDKTWIQEWADSTYIASQNDRPPSSPRHLIQGKCSPRTAHSTSGTPSKIPSPVGTMYLRGKQECQPVQDTEAYLLKTQNAITNLQAKLHGSRNAFPNIPPLLTTSLISENSAASRLPVSQLSRSNSLNYRLRRKEHSADCSPLRSPGNYVITGSTGIPASTKILLNSASKSLDTDRRRPRDSNMNSPTSDRGLLSNSSDDKTLSNRPYTENHRKTHSRHKSFDGKNAIDYFNTDLNNANSQVSLKTVLKNNALDTKYLYAIPRNIEQTRCQGDAKRPNHQRVFSDTDKRMRCIQSPTGAAFGSSIKRSSSFNTVTKNNNYIDPIRILVARRSSGQNGLQDTDYLSDESDNGSDKNEDVRFKRPVIYRARLDSPDLKSKAPANSPKCPNTPEMQRKFGPGLVRTSVRVPAKVSRMSEPPPSKEVRQKPASHQSRKVSEANTRQAAVNRLTKSRSSTREFEPKNHGKGGKKSIQHRSSSALATKEVEFSNWKKRSSYDPMKAALEGRKRQQQLANSKRPECNQDDLSSPSHSSPVHRSQSFHSTNMADLDTLDYSSEGTEDDQMLTALPVDHPMIMSTQSDTLDLRPKGPETRETRRQALCNDVVLGRDYITHFKVNQPIEKLNRRDIDKRKTFIVDDTTPTRDNIEYLKHVTRDKELDTAVDKRKTFILDSDTNSTTNGSSPRNSSIFSHEKHSLTTGTSDTEGESGTESAPVQLRHNAKKNAQVPSNKRHSGDYSMSSSTTSTTRDQKRAKDIQPRYLDISKYKSESSPKNFLRRDPSKTYVGVLNNNPDRSNNAHKGSAQQYEMEQKKQELEKWKRRASYDPRKSAALGKSVKTPPKTVSSVLRSQSFHGPVLSSTSLRYTAPAQIVETYDQSSDNDF